MVALYHKTKILISFLCRRELNLRFLIQQLETSPVELTKKKKKKPGHYLNSKISYSVKHVPGQVYI